MLDGLTCHRIFVKSGFMALWNCGPVY